MFSINLNHPVGDYTALSKKKRKIRRYSKARNLLHTFLNLIKQDIATKSQ